MKISTRLYLALALTAIMIAAIGMIHAWFEGRQAQEDDTAAAQVLIGKMAALSSLAHEYGANAHPRIERQWQVQVSTIRDLISKLHDFETVRSLDSSLHNADRAFSQLRQNNAERQEARTRSAGAKETARLNVIEGAIKSLMRMEVEKLLSSADLIAAESRQRTDALRRQAATVMMAIVTLFLALVVAMTLPAIRKTTRSISTLADGVNAFAEGNLAHRIAADGADEIGRLAAQFNAMAEAVDCSIQREREHSAALEREIEVRRIAEASLRGSEEQHRAFFELAAVGLAQADPRTGRLLRVNNRYCEIYGYPRDELLQMTSVQATYPEDREHNALLLERLHKGDTDTIDFDKRVVRKNGTIVWVHVNATVARDASGNPSRSLAVAIDITERKQAEQELRLSRQRLALHVEQTPLAVIEFDLEGRVQEWNPAAVRTFGFSREQAIGQHWKFMVPASQWSSLEQVWADLTTQRGGSRSSNENHTADGRIISCEWFNTPLIDSEGNTVGVASLAMDVTERKRSEAALQTAARELRAAYRRLAHAQEAERRNLTKELHDRVGQNLSAIHLHLQLIERELSADSRARLDGRLDNARSLLEETAEQIRNIMANQRPPMLDQYGLFATLRWLAHETSQRSGIPCTLLGSEPAERLPGEVESTLLRIAQEALMNAVKYSKAADITIALAATRGQARIEIADNGLGFDQSARDARDSVPTWGLLTMRERALAFGGSLHVDTAPGAGTRVTAEIPLA